MQLRSSSVQVDFFPVGTGKRFVQRVRVTIGQDNSYTSFRTVTRSEALYEANSRLANGAELTGFNTEEYKGTDYRPLFC